MLAKIAQVLTSWSTRWVPDAFVIAIILTFFTAGLVWVVTPAGPFEIIKYWGDGFWTLLTFSMQMCLIIMTGYIVGVAPPVKKLLNRIANLAKSPQSAVTLTALVAMVLCAINWGMGLITSAILVRFVATSTAQRGIRVDYRLLVACAYLGMAATWHAGLSGSVTLLVATPEHFMQGDLGIIPTTATTFHPFNITLVLIVIALLSAMAWKLHPSDDQVVTVAPNLVEMSHRHKSLEKAEDSPAAYIESSRWLSLVLGFFGVIWLGIYFYQNGFKPTLNVINLIFLTAGILLHRTPKLFIKAAEEGSKFLWYVIIQFPLYAGIFGMVKYSGFQDVAGQFIASIASASTFPLLTCWYSGLLNYIVPSGGGQWAVQAPYTMAAAAELGVSPSLTVLAFAWGEMITDGIQPFFCIPLLGITGVGFRDIMGFLLIFFIVYASVVSAAFLLVPYLNLF